MNAHELWGLHQTAVQIRDSALTHDDKIMLLRELRTTMPPDLRCNAKGTYAFVAGYIQGCEDLIKEQQSAPSIPTQTTARESVTGFGYGSGSVGGSTSGKAEAPNQGQEARRTSKAKNR